MIQLLRTCRSLVLMTVALIGVSLSATAQQSDKEAAKAAKVTTDLYQIMLNNGRLATSAIDGLVIQNNQVVKDNKVAIEAVASNGDGEGLLNQLKELGLTEGVAHKRMIFGYLPIDKIAELKNVSSLSFARPYYEPVHNTGLVTSQGDFSLKADVARTTYGVTGAGVKVGVISDSYNRLGGAANGVASGDLPTGVEVLLEAPSGGTDEGRAMAEIVHDVAPGSPIAFNTAYTGQAGFAQGILDLAAAGCKVIVDDIIYLAEPFFQDGIIAQAADQVAAAGNAYFSAAGNQARSSYQAPYKNGGTYTNPGFYGDNTIFPTHNFGSGTVDNLQGITIPAGGSFRIVLQWDNPFQSVSGGVGATTDLDVLILNATTGAVITYGANDQSQGGDPVEITGTVTNTTSAPVTVNVIVVKYSGPDPGLLKWVNFNSRTITAEYATMSSANYGHSNSSRAIAVGAAPWYNTPYYNGASTATIEPFSSAGGTPILFTTSGTRINGITGTVRQKPEITSVDGGNNTFFGSDTSLDPDTYPNFFGTSAAAPHAAAVAALMKQKVPAITPAAILSAMETTALDMDDPSTSGFDTGFDFGTGYGFIQADRALQAISNTAPTVANAIPPQSATVGQAYTYTIPANTFTDAETPNSLTLSVTGLPPGLSFTAPATISGTPTTAVGSPFSVTVTARDAGSLTAATMFAFTIVPASPSPTAPVAPTLPNQTATVGVAFSYVVPAFSGTTPITYTASGLPAGLSFDASSRTISGTPTMAQISTVMITGTNSAGSGSGSFTITVNAAPVGGTFAISGVTTNGCAQLTPDSRQVTFTPQYSNSDGSAISFRTINESVPTTAPGPYSLRLYTDNPVVTLEATQSGKVVTFSYNWLSACSTPPGPVAPVAPTLPNQTATVGVAFSYVVPAFSGTTPITYTASGLPAGLNFDASSRTISGTPTMAQISTVMITGTNSAGSGSGSFTITVNAAPVGGTFAISGVTTNGCAQLTPDSRQVTFTPQYSNSDGSAISFRTINESVPTTAPGPYSLRLYTDNPVVTLEATQSGKVSTFSYNWLSFCNTSSSRIGVAEQRETMLVTVLGNPVLSEQVDLEIRGAQNQLLRIQAADSQGRTVDETTITQAGQTERASLQLGRSTGVYLLRVTTPTQQQVIKLIRQ